jgi:A118 family predicted phage portal protein
VVLPTDPRTPWPPPQLTHPYAAFDIWSAWYSGDPHELARVYDQAAGYGNETPPIGHAGTILDRARPRWFWGRRLGTTPDLSDARLHVPLAGDIATTSADLLFAEPPQIQVEGEDGGPSGDASKPTTERLSMLMSDGGFLPVLIEAAEICASMSGVYLRAGWVDDVADHVIIDAIRPDCAVPEWVAGRLTAVTFWRCLHAQSDEHGYWRHLERHEASDNAGRVLHALYKGAEDTLGELVDLSEHPETERLAATTEAAPGEDRLVRQVVTGASRIAVEWIPNMRPPRKLRGTAYGRSDYDGIEPVLDAIDEAWTSWMRDLRIGKGRVLIPEAYLQNQGRGRGALFDAEQAVFTTIDALPASEGLAMQVVQFAIRVREHQDTVTALVAEALRGAGYSTQTFGLAGEVAATATEVVARERRSYVTRSRKILYWRAALARLLETALQIDVEHYKPDKVTAVRPKISFPDGVAQDPLSVANTVALIHGAEAASLYTRIAMINPDWEDPQIRDEMDRIRDDAKVTMQINTPPVPEPGTAAAAAEKVGPGTDAQGQAEQAAPGSGGGEVPPGPQGGEQYPQQQPPQTSAKRRPPRRPPTFARR